MQSKELVLVLVESVQKYPGSGGERQEGRTALQLRQPSGCVDSGACGHQQRKHRLGAASASNDSCISLVDWLLPGPTRAIFSLCRLQFSVLYLPCETYVSVLLGV